MSVLDEMSDTKAESQSPDSSPASSDSESQSSEPENILPSINEPDVSLDEMLSLACRQGKLDIVQLLLQSGAHVNHRNKAGNTPLLEACSQGHVSVANYLLENGSKIDAPTETTLDSALTWACTLGNTSIVDALLQKQADVEHRTKDGCTALMFACLAGHRDVAEKLLDANSEINVESESNKDSPLTFACWKGHYDVVELLLFRKANIEHRTKEGFSPLMFAALGGHSKVAQKLLQCDAQVNVPSGSNNDIPLTSACWKGHHNVVKLLLEYSSNIEHRTKDGCTPLMLAAREGHIYVADLLLKNNAQVNVPSGSENNIPLTLACWKGHGEVVQRLLDYNSNIEHRNKAGCTPLMLAAREGHFETTSLLLERNAQVNVPSGSNDDTPLTLACWKGHKNVVLLLLDAKSNIDHQTKTGCTPLMEATREGHKDVAEILLNHNADVELPDNYGQSPLFMACWKGHRDVADLLLQRSAYRDCRTKTGITPLFQACRENHISIVELLLEYGAGVNTPFPNSRENPMTLCAEKGHQELVELLLEKGASHDCHTKKGCSPIFLACKEGHLDIAKILLQQNANVETPDCRGSTPIMAAFKNGHVPVVDWLIKTVHHLPSDELCHKILMSSVDDKDKEVVVQQRSKCLATIQEMKKKRELLALKNAQNLVQELDDERDREEKKKKKKAAKRRDKNKRKKNKDGDKLDGCGQLNGVVSNHVDEYDELDEEETKDHIVPTENRIRCGDEKPVQTIEVLKISEMPSMPDSRTDGFRSNQPAKRKKNHKNGHCTEEQNSHGGKEEVSVNTILSKDNKQNKHNTSNIALDERHYDNTNNAKYYNGDQHLDVGVSYDNNSTPGSSSPVEVIQLLNKRLNITSNLPNIKRQLPKTSGVCTQSSSTSGPSRVAVSSQTEKVSNSGFISVTSIHKHSQKPFLPTVSSVAVTTSAQVTTTYSDPRMEIRNIAPPEVRQSHWEEETDALAASNSASRNSSFDEYRESDWKELSRTSKMVFFELTVPNSYCGRVIGKGGKKINLITDDSGAQITIDKPPSNTVPANRVITIKGVPPNAEKARLLVTKALNTPSLSSQEIVITSGPAMQITSMISKATTILSNSNPDIRLDNQVTLPSATSELINKKRPTKPLPSAEVHVTPLIPYSKVAKASSTLEELQKEVQSKARVSPLNQMEEEKPAKDLPRKDSSQDQPNTESKEISPPQVELNHPFQSNSYDSTFFFYDSYNPRKISEPGEQSQNFLFGEERKNLAKEIWPLNTSNKLNAGPSDDSALGSDRSRSISWTGRPKGEALTYDNSPACRSMSSDQLDQRNTKVPAETSAWSNTPCNPRTSLDDVDDEQVFTEEVPWRSGGKPSVEFGISSGATNDTCDVSSSPTSSVSSSKVELTTYFDNDSGMGGSNALDPTPTSLQSESQIGFQDQPYLDTALESQTWCQQRGAYSAPSSPALPRNAENLSRGSSPRPGVIRSHPSMDEINTNRRAWAKKQSAEQDQRWSDSAFRNPVVPTQNESPENHDSGLSPRNSERRTKSERQMKTIEAKIIQPPTNHVSKQWTVERFQDVRNLPDLLKQLALEKYTPKLEQNGVSLESIVNLTERDLQLYEVPKGPRLKILKACEVIRSHRHVAAEAVVSSSNMMHHHQQQQQQFQQQVQHMPQQQQQQQMHSQPRFFTPPPPPQSSLNATRLADQQQQQLNQPVSYNEKQPIMLPHHQQQQQQQQHQMFSSPYRFPDFLSYAPPPPHPPPPQMQQQGYNIIIPNNQQFLQQPTPHQQTVMAPRCEDFSAMSHSMTAPPPPNVDPMHQNQALMSQHQFMYPPDNQAFYYFHPQS